tara:strand:+ start:116 stop:589 length:474 start_codon:yes stop_codon:yes gene_type:complete
VTVSNAVANVSINEFVQSHTTLFTGLTPDKTYYAIVVSEDTAGNVATSTEISFTTLPVPVADTQAPIISSLTSSAVASTTAAISWNTDEAATGKLWFGTSTPLTVTGSPDQSSGTLTTNHSFDLTSLSASTTYYYVVSSTDAADNTATSSEHSLTTI